MSETRMEVELRAMEQYRAYFQKRNPPPVRETFVANNWWTYGTMGSLVVASVIVSGYHTIPMFIGEGANLWIAIPVAIAIFWMLELGIINLMFMLVKKHYEKNPNDKTDVSNWLKGGLALILIVCIGTNVYSEALKAGFVSHEVSLAIRILMGLSAPIMALVSGEVLAITTVDGKVKQRELDEQYDIQMVEYQNKFLAEWDARKGRILSSIRVEPMSNVHPNVSNGQTVLPAASTLGHKKVANGTELARAYFNEHPEALDIPSRDLVDIIGAGKSTINNVQRAMKGNDQ